MLISSKVLKTDESNFLFFPQFQLIYKGRYKHLKVRIPELLNL